MNLPARQTNTMAVIALIAGILGWTALPFLGSVGAIIIGHLARAEIRRNPNQDGDGMALAGLIMGYVMVVGCFLAVLLFILFLGGLTMMIPGRS
jgi:hypothetical protein